MPRSDGVDDRAVGENVSVPMKMRGKITGCLRHPGADDELQPGLVQRREVGGRQHAGVGGDDHFDPVEAVAGLELPHDRNDRAGFGRVAFVASDLQREAGAVNQQTDDDLRIDAPLLRVPVFPQVILFFGLEVGCTTMSVRL